MKKSYKEAYQAPEAKAFVLSQPLTLLTGFSFDGDLEDPAYDTDWGSPVDARPGTPSPF